MPGFQSKSSRRQQRLSSVVTSRIEGRPDPRTHTELNENARYDIARDRVNRALNALHVLPVDQQSKIETRVEVIKRIPGWQERLINSRRLGMLVLPKYREHFTLSRYAYGVSTRQKDPKLYYTQEELRGYVIPFPLLKPPRKEPASITPIARARHQDLVVAADTGASWAGALRAYIHPDREEDYEAAVGVGPDIDTLGLGEESHNAIDALTNPEASSRMDGKIGYLNDITRKLVSLMYVAELPAPPDTGSRTGV